MKKMFMLILLMILAINPLSYAEVAPIHYIKHERVIFLDNPAYIYYIDAYQIFVLSDGDVVLKLDDEYGILNATLNNKTIEVTDDGYLRLGNLKKGIHDITIEAASAYTTNISTTISDEGSVDIVYAKVIFDDSRYKLVDYGPKASLYTFKNYMMWYYENVDNLTFTASFDDLYKPPIKKEEPAEKGIDYRIMALASIIALSGVLFALASRGKNVKRKR